MTRKDYFCVIILMELVNVRRFTYEKGINKAGL